MERGILCQCRGNERQKHWRIGKGRSINGLKFHLRQKKDLMRLAELKIWESKKCWTEFVAFSLVTL